MRHIGLDCLTLILWYKIANGATDAKRNGSGFYGKPNQPGQVIKNDIEHICSFEKAASIDPSHKCRRAFQCLLS
jgi:hypothetical protein